MLTPTMRNVLITGASGNLGKAVVARFLEENYQVLVTSSGNTGRTESTNVKSYEADLTREDSAASLVKQILTEHKTIDAAVLLVGGFAIGGLDDANGTLLEKMMALNFNTAYYVARPVFRQMMVQPTGGRIILIGARPALQPKDGKNMIAYSLSKSLLFKLAELLNAAGESKNVVTSVVVPSVIDTPANRQSMPDADFSKWVEPREIADAIAYICSPEARSLRQPVFKMYGQG